MDPPGLSIRISLLFGAILICAQACESNNTTLASSPAPEWSQLTVVRIATYNVSLSENADQSLLKKLRSGNTAARNAAAVIQHIRPDILVLNEFDYDAGYAALQLFQTDYLEAGQYGQDPIQYAYAYAGPVNTGVPSGLDLDLDGQLAEPEDAYGFGRYPGQYGMALLSRFPLDASEVRTFQLFAWSDMPNARLPRRYEGTLATAEGYYPAEVAAQLRISSKSHWDVPIHIGDTTLHALMAHPTPPAFDGPEDRNGLRNHDEIRLLHDYLAGFDYLVDDQGRSGGLAPDALFFAAGDFNADPVDGASRDNAILQLLNSPHINSVPVPSSAGAQSAAAHQGQANLRQQGDPAHDTADFGDARVGNLRVDYVLPSARLTVQRSGVFWPLQSELGFEWIQSSDHRLVWVDVALPGQAPNQP